MTPCPSCHQAVEILDKHLGTLYTCSHCNAVFFVNWEGQPEMASHETEEPMVTSPEPGAYGDETRIEPYAPPIVETAEEAPAYYEEPQAYQQEPEASENAEESFQHTQIGSFSGEAEPAEEPLSYEHSSEDTPENTSENTYEAPSEVAEEEPYDFGQSLDQMPAELVAAPDVDNSNFSDVTDFANTNESVGPLSYVVIIDGIDSSFLLKQLKEAMTDSRFGWDVSTVLEQLGGGRLILNGLSPAKASVLINRIKYLPFKISWRQDVLASS